MSVVKVHLSINNYYTAAGICGQHPGASLLSTHNVMRVTGGNNVLTQAHRALSRLREDIYYSRAANT